jgi:hypothetical protein
MATNSYFTQLGHAGEQGLIEDLIIESIKIHGLDVFYLPRTLGSEDKLMNSDDLPLFQRADAIEMYIKNVDSFEGEGDLFSKFGIQIRDAMTLSVAIKRFNESIGTPTGLPRPDEGDLIYFPLNRKMFEIMHVEHESIFYQFGKLQMYDLKVELLEYSNQRFQTGNAEIDALFADYDMTANTDIEDIDPWADNTTIQNTANTFIDFSEADPFSAGGSW